MSALLLAFLCAAAATSSLASTPAAVGLSDKLNAAIQKKDYEKFVQELSRDGVDTNQPDSKGRLPIVEAVRTKELRYVDSLIQYFAFVRVTDAASGSTPLHVAIQLGLVDVTRVLLSYGASLEVLDKNGKKPKDLVGSNKQIREMIELYEAKGALAFEDEPGVWTKSAKENSDDEYWFNSKTTESRWNTPPSCAWQRLDVQGMPAKYVNSVTGQETTRTPPALAWRLVKMGTTDEVWYNWAINTTQLETPQEVPEKMLKEIKQEKNVRWYNEKTKEFTWEDPKYHTHWRMIKEEGADKPYYYDITTGKSTWDAPDEMAWVKEESNEHPGHYFYYNPKTGESQWEAPSHLSWARHDSDL